MPDAHHWTMDAQHWAILIHDAQHWAILGHFDAWYTVLNHTDQDAWCTSLICGCTSIESYWCMMYTHIDAWCTALSHILMPDSIAWAMDAQHWAIWLSMHDATILMSYWASIAAWAILMHFALHWAILMLNALLHWVSSLHLNWARIMRLWTVQLKLCKMIVVEPKNSLMLLRILDRLPLWW